MFAPSAALSIRRVANIVVIEDEPGIVDFLQRGLAAAGFRVRSARDGDIGLKLALSDRVDLVVLDLMLPGRSGAEILAELGDERPGGPVIVLAARGGVGAPRRAAAMEPGTPSSSGLGATGSSRLPARNCATPARRPRRPCATT